MGRKKEKKEKDRELFYILFLAVSMVFGVSMAIFVKNIDSYFIGLFNGAVIEYVVMFLATEFGEVEDLKKILKKR